MTSRESVQLAFILVLSTLLLQRAVSADDTNWPQWRGPGGQGISPETGLPIEWSKGANVRWVADIEGRGHSSPAVWGDNVFVTTAIEGPVVPGAKPVVHIDKGEVFLHPDSMGATHSHTFKVLCLDAETGKVRWERVAYEGTVYDDRHRMSSYASPTPATDGRHVYVYFGSEGLYCYDLNGNLVWKRHLGGVATFGMGVGTSPLVYRSMVILQVDENTGERSFITALDKGTGDEVWRVPREVQASFSTPLLIEDQGRTELVTNGNEAIIAYDPDSGKELWRVKGVESNAIHTPVAGHGMVFVTAGYPRKITKAIKLGGSGDLTGTANVVWEYEKGTAYVSSNLLYGDYLYLVSDKGILTCIDAASGKIVYEGGRVPVPSMFKASPVGFDGHILMASEDGDVFVVKGGPVHEVLAVNSIEEPIWASPAIADGKIFIRSEKHLYCIAASSGD